MTPIVSRRAYTFSHTSAQGYLVHWIDVAYNRFEDNTLTITSPQRSVSDQFGIAEFTYFFMQHLGQKLVTTDRSFDPFGTLPTWAKVGISGPATLILQSETGYVESEAWKDATGHLIGANFETQQEKVAVDVFRGVLSSWEYAETYDGTMELTEIPKNGSIPQVLPGDFRRPASARATGALTDDELFAVNKLAGQCGMSGPQLLAILLELTGARRAAFHTDGFFGISNLTAAQLAATAFPGAATPKDFLQRSVHVQLDATAKYLAAQGGMTGVVPVFLTLASGAPTLISTPGHTPLPPRLQPLSSDGKTIGPADIFARVNPRVDALTAEFNARLPDKLSIDPPFKG